MKATRAKDVVPTPARLRELRKSVGLTQEDAARVAKVSCMTLKRAELGHLASRDIPLSIALKLVDFCTWAKSVTEAQKAVSV